MRTSEIIPSSIQAPAGSAEKPSVLGGAVALWQALPAEERFIETRFPWLLCRSIAMQSRGAAEADYDALVVASGLATAFSYHPQRYQSIYVTPDPPEEVDARIARAVGMGWESLGQAASSEQAWRTLRDSIDDGLPVVGSWIDDIVFCGYSDARLPNDRSVLVAGGWDRPCWWTWERFDKWAAEFGLMGRPGGETPRADALDMACEIIQTIVRSVRSDGRAHVDGLRHAIYGLEGIAAFADDLSDHSNTPDHWYAGWLGGHCIARQVSGRSVAANYLARNADLLGRPARDRVRHAAQAYDEAAQAWEDWERVLGTGIGTTDPDDIRLAWMDTHARRAGSEAARVAAEHEREAVALLESAIAG